MFRRGGFAILVKRVAKYEVFRDGEATVETVLSHETLFPRALLHTSAIAHVITSKFALGVSHYRLEQHLADQGVRLDLIQPAKTKDGRSQACKKGHLFSLLWMPGA